MGIEENIKIDHCPRIIQKKKDPTRPRNIICRLTKFKEKQKILINAKILKNTGICIYEDYCKDTMIPFLEQVLNSSKIKLHISTTVALLLAISDKLKVSQFYFVQVIFI